MTSSDNTRRMHSTDTGEPPAHSPVRRTRVTRDAAVVLGGLAIALALTPVLCVIPAGAGLIGPLWLLAILWTIRRKPGPGGVAGCLARRLVRLCGLRLQPQRR